MTSELFDGIFGTTSVVAATDDAALVDALCTAETALARACAQVGIVALPTALEIGAACDDVRRLDSAELARRSAYGGNPVIPLVVELRARVEARAGAEAAAAVHLGATSQDIIDTALMLVAKQALGVVTASIDDAARSCAQLAREHRDTAMPGRTLLQWAVPTTFGAAAAGWGTALDSASVRLADVRAALPVQLGGAAGTLAALHPHGFAVLDAFADECDLVVPRGVWHTDRTIVTELAGALGTASAAVAKIATDLVLLGQSDVAEVRERAPGGSSAMPHKQKLDRGGDSARRRCASTGSGRNAHEHRTRVAAWCGQLARRVAGVDRPAAIHGRRGCPLAHRTRRRGRRRSDGEACGRACRADRK